MNPEHTPGPWIVKESTADFFMIRQYNEYGYFQPAHATAWQMDGAGVAEANARLIAASPDLLEACKNLENDNGAIPDNAWNMIRAAVAKAEGRDES